MVGLAILALPVWAQDAVEEIVVTGSYIKHSPEDAPVPIDVIDSEEMFNTGSPSVVELVKTLGVSSGVDGESNYFQSNGLGGTANVNLRGLGAGRNLVLLNGRRNVFSPYAIAEQQQLFVDINMIPSIALGRVELLKDGAAATYGSDAISGVVNFITRADFEGLEFTLSHKDIDGSDGDQDFGVIWGQDFGRTHIMAAFEYNKRNQLQIRERDWAIHRRGENGNFRGYSSSPNPGAFLDWRKYRADNPTGTPAQNNIRTSKTVDADPPATQYGIIDSRCNDIVGDFGKHSINDGRCTYNYTYFDNLIEEQTRSNLFAQLSHEFADDMQLNIEFLYAQNDVPNWYTSPSYPPQLDFDTRHDTGRFVHAYHPALVEIANEHDEFKKFVDGCEVTEEDDCRRLLFYGRPLGAAGPSEKRGFREYETTRLAVGLEGTFDNDVDYITSLLWSEANGKRAIYDAISERWSEALEGYGLCGRYDENGERRDVDERADNAAESGSTAECVFHNPFTNAIERPQQKYTADFLNPDYAADLANPYALYEWMSDAVGGQATSTLAVWDGILSGESANGVGWAFGAQYRQEQYKLTPNDISNLHVNPCATVAENTEFRESKRAYNPDGINCAGEDGEFADLATTADIDESDDNYTGSGPFTFLAGETPFDDKQDVIALFGELLVPSTDNIELQLSARYEDYGGDVGSSFDPKIALRWQVMDNLALSGSASSTFRAPTLNQLGGRTTALSFLSAAGTFKAVDSIGSAGLDPEKATTINLGVLFDADDMFTGNDNLRFSLDYWSFDFTDPIIREDFNAIAKDAFSATDDKFNKNSLYADRISCGVEDCTSDDTALELTRVKTFIVNGPAIETNGFDIAAGYRFDALQGEWDVSLQLTSISAFDVAASDLNPDGIDALGKLNDAISFLRPIVENKAKFGVRYNRGAHLLNFMANYTSSYQDAQNSAPDRKIAEHTTFDLHYNLSLENIGDNLAQSAVWVSVYNLTDEDPPIARLDMNYDPYTHNPFGQMIKIGVRHKF